MRGHDKACPPTHSASPRYYTDEDYYHAELERFFFGKWIHAGRVDHIPGRR